MPRKVKDVIDIFRRITSKRNPNDPDANFDVIIRYINDFYALHMNQDVHLFKIEGTLKFVIANKTETVNDGVITFNEIVGQSSAFEYLTVSGYVDNNDLVIWHNPKEFFDRWQEFDTTLLTAGMPTDMLFYGNELIFRTVPDKAYTIRIFGYKRNTIFEETGDNVSQELPFDEWVRYIAYGAARNYAQDFNFDEERKASIKAGFMREKGILQAREHNVRKYERSIPRF